LLEAWRATVNDDPDLTTGSQLSRTLFNDHIPDILDSFALRLQAWPNDIDVQVQQQESQGTNQCCGFECRVKRRAEAV
jgi:hypothetical protein